MSNKETFQNYNNRLNKNNTNLTSILNTINNLPSSGSGGSPKITFFNCELVKSQEVEGVTERTYGLQHYLGYILDTSKTYKFVILLNDGNVSVINEVTFKPAEDGGYVYSYSTSDQVVYIGISTVTGELPEIGFIKSGYISLGLITLSEVILCCLVEL